MHTTTLMLTLAAWLPIQQPPAMPTLEGVVVNGTHMNAPVAMTEVILRAGRGNALQQVAKTQTDAQGRFVFRDVPWDSTVVYLAGANHGGIHYPGPRLHMEAGRVASHVTLTVYDTVASPSPLVAEKYEIVIHAQPTLLDVTETLLVQNPSLTTFVGEANENGFAETLRLAIPNRFQRVTFHQEFFGRRFKLGDQCVVTDIPWTPGKRELKFTYQLPRPENGPAFERFLDLPCFEVRLRLVGDDLRQVDCNLARVEGGSDFVFASTGTLLTKGEAIRLQLGGVARPWLASVRWVGLSALALLILATAAYARRRNAIAGTPLECKSGSQSAQPPKLLVKQRRPAA
jgi:hypothetical protein